MGCHPGINYGWPSSCVTQFYGEVTPDTWAAPAGRLLCCHSTYTTVAPTTVAAWHRSYSNPVLLPAVPLEPVFIPQHGAQPMHLATSPIAPSPSPFRISKLLLLLVPETSWSMRLLAHVPHQWVTWHQVPRTQASWLNSGSTDHGSQKYSTGIYTGTIISIKGLDLIRFRQLGDCFRSLCINSYTGYRKSS